MNEKPGNRTSYASSEMLKLRWDVIDEESDIKECEYGLGILIGCKISMYRNYALNVRKTGADITCVHLNTIFVENVLLEIAYSKA